MKELLKLITEREGKKSQVSIGDLREILKIIADILANDPIMMDVFKRYVKQKEKSVIAKKKAK